MAIRYTYQSFPDCPEATEYSKNRGANGVHLGGLIVIASLWSACSFIYQIFTVIGNNSWDRFFTTLGYLLLSSVALYYYYVRGFYTDYRIKTILIKHRGKQFPEEVIKQACAQARVDFWKNCKDAAVEYYSWFAIGLIGAISVIWLLQGIFLAFVSNIGRIILVGSLNASCLVGLAICWKLDPDIFSKDAKADSNFEPVPTKTEPVPQKPEPAYIRFCRRCGDEIGRDSACCPQCGTQIKRGANNGL